MKKPIKRLAVIHDLCGIGKAALTNIMPVLAVMEVEVCPIPTMILSTHTGGFGKPYMVKLDGYVSEAVNHYEKIDIEFDGIFIGYLGSKENIDDCLCMLKKYEEATPLVIVDPIFGDNGKYYSNFDESYSNNLKELIRYADVITPNYTEACLLSGISIKEKIDINELEKIIESLIKFGARNIVITSLPLGNNMIGTCIYNEKKKSIIINNSHRQEKSYPGTGDIFTSALSGYLLNGGEIEESTIKACGFVEKCMEVSSKYDYPAKEGVLLEMCLKYLYE